MRRPAREWMRRWRGRAFSLFFGKRSFLWAGAVLGGLVVAGIVAVQFADEPLRRSIERKMNAGLVGYTARVESVDLHILGLWTDVRGITVRQDRHPDPPVLIVPRLTASVHWRALTHGRLVADCRFEHPLVHVNLPQLREEATDEVPIDKRGWQDALQAVYPLKIDQLTVNDGELSYQDEDDPRPLEISQVFFLAEDIRNSRSKKGVYPSTIQAHGVVFETGRIAIDGKADFLLKPIPGIAGELVVERVDLEYFQPLAHHLNLRVKGGSLAAAGRFEYAPERRSLQLDALSIDHAVVDYVTSPRTIDRTELVRKAVSKAAKEIADDPTVDLAVRRLGLTDCEVGYANEVEKPPYRIFVRSADAEITNLSNRPERGEALAMLRGRFMDAGVVRARARFLPEGEGPNFEAAVQIEKTDLRVMNDLLRAYGHFDVARGTFSFYSEVKVRDGWVDGYVKPMFKDLNVYDSRQDKKKNIFRRAYEAIVGGVAKVLENRKRKEIATVTSLSGPLGNTRTDTLEVIGGLVKNAFLKAILPGFENELGGRSGHDEDKEGKEKKKQKKTRLTKDAAKSS